MSIVGVWRRYLQVKVLSLIVAILVVGFGVLGVWNIRTQAAAVLEQHKEASRSLADAIVQSIESSMLAGRPDIVRVLSRGLHELEDVEQITIFRINGVEAFTDLATLEEVQQGASLDPDVVDKIRSMQARPTRRMHHPLFQQAVDSGTTQELIETVNDVPMFALLYPLRNEERCQKCHGRDHLVRGVVSISTSMARTTAALQAYRTQQGAVALLTILGVAGVLSLSLGRVVLRPLRVLATVAQQIGQGDFAIRVPVRQHDEIGTLATAVNQMAVHLQQSYTELEHKAATNEAMATENARLYLQVQQQAEALEVLAVCESGGKSLI